MVLALSFSLPNANDSHSQKSPSLALGIKESLRLNWFKPLKEWLRTV
jgi:hypothetical protein